MENSDESGDSTNISLGQIVLNQGGVTAELFAGSLVLGQGTNAMIFLDTGLFENVTLAPIVITVDGQEYWVIGAPTSG
jgi:hypothetical protein